MVSVILPTYNEKENIKELIDNILANLQLSAEIIVVDDDSPDKTWEIVEGMSKVNKDIKLLRRLENKGLASAIRDGINFAKGEKIVLMDADFSMPPDILMHMINFLDSFDIVVGSRYVEGSDDLRDSGFRVFCSRIFNVFAKWLLNSAIRDLTSGFLAFKKTAIDSSSIRGRYGEYCIELLHKAQKADLRILELPYNCTSRKKGKTKTSPNIFIFIRYGILYILFILKLRFRYTYARGR